MAESNLTAEESISIDEDSDNLPYDAVVIGAGAAGIGVGITLQHVGIERFLIVDRESVGSSFAAMNSSVSRPSDSAMSLATMANRCRYLKIKQKMCPSCLTDGPARYIPGIFVDSSFSLISGKPSSLVLNRWDTNLWLPSNPPANNGCTSEVKV